MTATVLDGVTPAMRIYGEESFGPVVIVLRANGHRRRRPDRQRHRIRARRRGVRPRRRARARGGEADRIRHLPRQFVDRRRRGADAVRRHQGVGLRPLRRQGRDRRSSPSCAGSRSRPDRRDIRSRSLIQPMDTFVFAAVLFAAACHAAWNAAIKRGLDPLATTVLISVGAALIAARAACRSSACRPPPRGRGAPRRC